MARIQAVVRRQRRSRPAADQGPLVVGELEIRPDQYQAFSGGRSVDLTRREFELLNTLAEAAGKVLEREEIYRRVWGYEMAHGDRSVDVFVRKLRSKVQRFSPGWEYIHTHFGIGYRFEPESLGEPPPSNVADIGEAKVRDEDREGESPVSSSAA
jgi:DNA-binding response OmpR family regulator